jgi:diguanylate cyclase (GGDEF)-like protein
MEVRMIKRCKMLMKISQFIQSLTEVRMEVKIMGIVIGISMFALIVGGIGLMNMAKINRMSAKIYQKELLGVSLLKEAYVNLICLARAEKNVMLSFTKEDKRRYLSIHNDNKALFLNNLNDAQPLLETEQEKINFIRLGKAWKDYCVLSAEVLDFAYREGLNKSRPSITLAMGPARNKINDVTDALDDLTRMKEENARILSAESTEIYRSSRLLLTFIIIGGVILAIALGILLTFIITAPIRRAEAEKETAIRALRESEEKYRELSIIDDLTQLYNSRHFYHQIKMEIDRVHRYGQPLSLLLMDLDDFKKFNDTYGHVEGDQVLKKLGQIIKGCLRQTDSAYRYGGEEFTVLLPMTAGKDGAVIAERIRSEFKRTAFNPPPGKEVHMTVSIGLAQYKPQEEIKAFVHWVDYLMYQGKKSGKDKVCSENFVFMDQEPSPA